MNPSREGDPGQKPRPSVVLEHTGTDEGNWAQSSFRDHYAIKSEGSKIGELWLARYLFGTAPIAWIQDVWILDRLQDQGIGKAVYLELLRTLGDLPLHSGNINPHSGRLWLSLVRDGLAAVQPNGKFQSLPEAVKARFPASP